MSLSVQELRDKVIEAGIAEITNAHYPEAKKQAGIEGMEICRNLLTLAEYRRVLAERNTQSGELLLDPDRRKQYKYHRFANAQIEHVFEIMRVAWGDSGPKSERAVNAYRRHMGLDSTSQLISNN